jgi:DNA-binding response OmpR family regulator
VAQQLTPRTRRVPRVAPNTARELWVLVIEEQGRPNHSLLRRLRERMRADVAREQIVPFVLAFEGLFDTILVARSMEGKEGSLALSRLLREARVTTPIVILAESATANDIVRAIEAGADDVLPASVGGEMLVARLRSLKRRAAFNRSDFNNVMRHTSTPILDGRQRKLA